MRALSEFKISHVRVMPAAVASHYFRDLLNQLKSKESHVMKHNFRKRVLLFAILSVSLSGCGFLGSMRKPDDRFRAKNNYSYLGNANEIRNTQKGIVIGKIDIDPGRAVGLTGAMVARYYETDANAGSIFKISRVENGRLTPETFSVRYHYSKNYGIIPLGTDVKTVPTDDVFAGNLPRNRDDDFKEMGSVGMLTSDLFLGTTRTRRALAYNTNYPPGWFIVQLAPGRYRIHDIQHEYYTDQTTSNTSRTVTTYTFSVPSDQSVEFEVVAGNVNYIGNYRYSFTTNQEFELIRNVTEDVATSVLNVEMKRRGVSGFNWPRIVAK
jgi:hypothetical protein